MRDLVTDAKNLPVKDARVTTGHLLPLTMLRRLTCMLSVSAEPGGNPLTWKDFGVAFFCESISLLLLLNPSLEHSQRLLSSFYELLNVRAPWQGRRACLGTIIYFYEIPFSQTVKEYLIRRMQFGGKVAGFA